MIDIVLELLRALVVGAVIFALLRARHTKAVSRIAGWWTLVAGFILIFFGTLIDITDNFEELNRFVIVGDTGVQAFLEKVIGYLLGFLLLAFGIWRWLPKLIEHEELIRKKLEVQEERLKVLRATMATVNDIVNNFLNQLQLFRIKAEKKNALEPELLALMDTITQNTTGKLKKLSELDSTPEKKVADSIVIDYEKSSSIDIVQSSVPADAERSRR